VRALRVVGRGLRDTYDNLYSFCMASVLWWMATLPVVLLWPIIPGFALLGFLLFGPAATLALFAATDPRRAVSRPDLAEMLAIWRSRLTYSWKLIAVTLPIPLVLFNNILVFGGSSDALATLTPLWTVLFVIMVSLTLVAFGVAAMFELSIRETLKRAVYVLVAAPFRTLFVLAWIVILIVLGAVMVVPLILFVPALVGAILDRHLVQVFKLEVIDPNTPTEERLLERKDAQPGRGRSWWR
jgi:uncharacterized membrane protein YesL